MRAHVIVTYLNDAASIHGSRAPGGSWRRPGTGSVDRVEGAGHGMVVVHGLTFGTQLFEASLAEARGQGCRGRTV
jgi:hypothetical protein